MYGHRDRHLDRVEGTIGRECSDFAVFDDVMKVFRTYRINIENDESTGDVAAREAFYRALDEVSASTHTTLLIGKLKAALRSDMEYLDAHERPYEVVGRAGV